MKRWVANVALGLAAALIAAAGWLSIPLAAGASSAPDEGIGLVLDCERRLARVATLLDSSARVTDAATPSSESSAPVDPDARKSEIGSALDALERRLEVVDARLAEAATSPDAARNAARSNLAALADAVKSGLDDFPSIPWLRSLDEVDHAKVTKLQDLARDVAAEADARLDALLALRQLDLRDGGARREPAVCAAALELAKDGDERRREAALRSIAGTTYPFLSVPLRAAARDDSSFRVRDTAVGALRSLLPDAAIEADLRWLRDNDPHPAVRDEADEALRSVR